MRRGRPLKPIISLESITTALKTLDYSSQGKLENHALESLQVIDFNLQTSNRPLAENIRTWMLGKILVDFVTTALNETRQYFNLVPISLNQSRKNETKLLSEVSQLESPELLGWSILYVRYVRPELGFSIQEIAYFLHINERTVRRYQDIAIKKLRDFLIEAEWQTREEQQSAYLRSQIPHQIVDVVGRDDELNNIFSHLNQKFSFPIRLSGETGIGKSAICAHVAYKLIDEKKIDYLIWLRQPSDMEAIQTKIWNIISPHEIQNHWREILEHQKLLIVIEDADELLDTSAWSDLLVDLQNAYVLITSEKPSLHVLNVYSIHLKPLSMQFASILLTRFFANCFSDHQTEVIVETAFGNPRKIIEIGQRSVQDAERLEEVLETIHDEHFNVLTFEDKLIILLNTFSKHGIDKRLLEIVLNITPAMSLRYEFLLEKGSLVYLSDSYINYIKNRLHQDPELQLMAKDLIYQLIENVAQDLTVFTVLLDCIESDFYSWDRAIIQNILESIDVSQILIGDVFRWRSIYLKYFGLDGAQNLKLSMLAYKHGVALRRIHHVDSEVYLISLIEFFGKNGLFELQVQVSFELALLYHNSASFKKAIKIYNHINQSLPQYASAEILSSIQLQYARIAIMRHNVEDALGILQGCNLDNSEVLILFCEAQFLKSEHDFIIETIPSYLSHSVLSHKIGDNYIFPRKGPRR